jgi:MFS family permease
MTISRRIAWVMWMAASIFYAYQFVIRVMPNIMIDDIMQQYQIDAAVFGQFSGIYYIGYVLMHLPIGIMLDRYGPKRVMSACILLTVLGLLPILVSDYWIFPIIGRFLIGVGSSAAILGAFKIIRMSFREEHFTRMLSLAVTIGLIGAIYGGGPVAQMCAAWGYKTVIQIFAAAGILLAVLTYIVVPKFESIRDGNVMSDIKTVFTNGRVIAVCLFAGLLVGPMEGFADVWASDFLKQVYGFDPIVAGYLPSMIFLGFCFGAPVFSFFAEKSGMYLGSIIGAGLVMLATFVALVMGLLTVSSMTVSFIIVGVCCAYQILAIYKASTYVPEKVAGLTTAVANMIIMSFGYLFHTTIGLVVKAYGGTHAASAFIYGVSVIPIALALGTIGFIVISYQENRKVSKNAI